MTVLGEDSSNSVGYSEQRLPFSPPVIQFQDPGKTGQLPGTQRVNLQEVTLVSLFLFCWFGFWVLETGFFCVALAVLELDL